MKITNTNQVNNNPQVSNNIEVSQKKVQEETQKSYVPASECTSALGSAQVNMQRTSIDFDKLNSIVNSIINQDTQKVRRHYIDNGVQRAQIGQLVKEWGLYDTVAHVAMFPDSSDVYFLDKKSREIKIYDENAQLKKEYSKDEVNALYYYKYHPDSIHVLLREGREMWSGDLFEETKESIKGLDKIFADSSKTFKNEKPRVLYRALQRKLSDEEIQKLSTIGEVFVEKSFVSTSTSFDTARGFRGINPILEIEFPEGAEYMDLDKLFNIDRRHWHEDEFLLNRNSKFLVTGFDTKNNIIKVKYCI